MEKLTEQQRGAITKMSDNRLRNKLTVAGYDPELLSKLDCAGLVSAWAELVASGAEQGVPEAAEARAEYPGGVKAQPGERGEEFEAGPMSLEERRLILEERRFEEQKLQRQQEERRWLREMELKEKELAFNRAKADQEQKQKDSKVAKLKLWGDALRNSITNMPSEPIDVISWFICLERLFVQLEVPADLKAVLMRPYLSERAKALLARCDAAHAADYDAIKKYLLQEMRLSSSVYLDKFNSVTRDSTETFYQFSTRLLSLFEFYVESRKVDKSYDKLLELVVYDRIKSVLPQFLAKHVLALESAHKDGWLGRQALVEALDAYMASTTPDGRAKVAAIGQQKSDTPFKQTTENKGGGGDVKKQPNGNNGGRRSAPAPAPVPAPRTYVRRCYECGSPNHVKSSCPQRRQNNFDGRNVVRNQQPQPVPQPRVHACVREPAAEPPVTHAQAAAVGPPGPNPSQDDQLFVNGRSGSGQQAEVIVGRSGVQGNRVNKVVLTSAEIDSLPLDDMSSSVVKPPDVTVDPLLASGWSHLHYVNVEIEGLPDIISALDDSGAQLCCVRADVVAALGLPKIGQTTLRGITSESVLADLVCVRMKLCGGDVFVPVTCAVCDNLNSTLILGSDVVNRLHTLMLKEHYLSDDAVSDKTCLDCHVIDADVCVRSDDVAVDDGIVDDVDVVNDTDCVIDAGDDSDMIHDNSDCNDHRTASVDALIAEQKNDKSLANCWSLADRAKAGYFVRDGILYRRERILGHEYEQLCLPVTRRALAIKLAHETYGGHLAAKKTKARLKLSFTWPTIAIDVQRACEVCKACQHRRRVTVYDRVPISPIPRDDTVFQCWVMDCLGPLFPNQKVAYNYCLVLCDSCSRYPVAFPLRSLTAKSVCNALLQLFQTAGIPSVIRSDCATNFTSQLTRTFLSMLGCSPRFNVPGRPQQTGLCERLIGTLKNMISKLAMENPKSWVDCLGFSLWALREVPNETTGVPPWVMVYGRLPRGPLAVLKENWCGQREAPLSLGQSTVDYLQELRKNLEVAETYATSHSERAQQRYVSRYNLRTRPKSFTVGEQVLILSPDSTSSKVFSKWRGPATVIEVQSPHSYIVEIDGSRRHLHADKLRKYHINIAEVTCKQCPSENTTCNNVHHCSIIYEQDTDFGMVKTVDPVKSPVPDQLLPSQKIDPAKLSHLTEQQQVELLAVLDEFPECFSDSPGYCNLVEHEIHVTKDFKPKRLRAYRVPESIKPEVEKQINDMLKLGIIRPSKSEMASPIVCVLKGKDGRDGVRIAIDYRYVNKYSIGDAFPMPDISDLIQRVGQAKIISTFDAKGAYWQIGVRPDHQWLTAFVWDGGLYEFTRTPFGQKGSGNTFVRAVQLILQPIKQFTGSYVDDMSVFSDVWAQHLKHLKEFLLVIRDSGLTLNLKKCNFALPEVKFVGHIIGSGQRRADPDKVSAVKDMKTPETKKQIRQILGFFSYFREYIANFAELAKPLTDLTCKRVPAKIPWEDVHRKAFEELKLRLCQATTESLQIVDFAKPFAIHVDASDFQVAGVLSQPASDGSERPVAFISLKLTPAQRAWATVEKEAFAAIWALKRFRNWIFGKPVTLYTDHNPLTYLTESAPNSAKLTRWALAIQQYDVTFCYKAGKKNVAADCLSRLEPDGEPASPQE